MGVGCVRLLYAYAALRSAECPSPVFYEVFVWFSIEPLLHGNLMALCGALSFDAVFPVQGGVFLRMCGNAGSKILNVLQSLCVVLIEPLLHNLLDCIVWGPALFR